MTYLYHVTDDKGRTGLLADQAFHDKRSCGWEYMWQAQDWALMGVDEDGRDRYVMRVSVDKYKRDPNFSYAVIVNDDIQWIETAQHITKETLSKLKRKGQWQ